MSVNVLSMFEGRPEAPEDLAGKVGCPGLGGVACRLYHGVQGDDHLETGVQQVLGRHFPKWTLLVDDVDDCHGPEQQGSVLAPVQLCADLVKRFSTGVERQCQ